MFSQIARTFVAQKMSTNIMAGLLCDDVVDEEVVVSSEQPERMVLCEHGSTESHRQFDVHRQQYDSFAVG